MPSATSGSYKYVTSNKICDFLLNVFYTIKRSMKSVFTFFIITVLNLQTYSQMTESEYSSCWHLIYHGDIALNHASPNRKISTDSLKRVLSLTPKNKVKEIIKLLKTSKLSSKELDILLSDSAKVEPPFIGKTDLTSIAYFILACEANWVGSSSWFADYENFYMLDSYFINHSSETISSFAGLRKLKYYYSDRTYNNRLLLTVPDSLINKYNPPNFEEIASKFNGHNTVLKNNIIESYHLKRTDCFNILGQILTQQIDTKKQWKEFIKLGKTIFNPKINYSLTPYLDTYIDHYGINFKKQFERAYIMRFVNNIFFTIESISYLTELSKSFKNEFLSIVYELRPNIYNEYFNQNINDGCPFSYRIDGQSYERFLKSLLYVNFVGDPLINLETKIDFLIHKK